MEKNLCTIIFAHPRLLMFCCLHSNVNSFVCFWLNGRMKGGGTCPLSKEWSKSSIPHTFFRTLCLHDTRSQRDVSSQNFSTPLSFQRLFSRQLAQNKIRHRDFHSSFYITLLIFIDFFIINITYQPGYVLYVSSRVVPIQW